MRAFVIGLAGLGLGLLPLRAGLVAFYSFDDTGNPLVDDSGNWNDLANSGSDPLYVPTGGVQGGAYQFDGTQRLISPLVDINYDVRPLLTMGAWVRTSSLVPGNRKFLGHDDGGYDRVVGLDTRNGPFRYTAFIGTGDPPPGTATPTSTNEWTFVAVTYDDFSATMTLYVDLDSLSIQDPLDVVTSPSGMGLGQTALSIGSLRPDNADEGWVGMMDNVFIYDEVLTVEQLTAIRDGGKGAIVAGGAEDPDLRVVAKPQLRNLPKSPAVLSFSYGLKNVGASRTLAISAVTPTGADASRYKVVSFPATLAPGASGTIEFTFDSQGQVGAYSGALEIASNDPSQPMTVLEASAQVGDDPDLVLVSAPNLQDLAKLPPIQTLAFGIRNGGVFDTLKIDSITLGGLDAGYFTVKSYPATLGPGAEGTIEVTFNPQGQVGSFSVMATIVCNDASTPTITVDMSARITGTALLGFYSFDNEAAPTQDDSGNGRTLGSAGAATDPLYDNAGGVAGGGYVFDGGQRWVAPLDINAAQIPLLTMGAWVKTTAASPGLYKVLGHDDGGWDRVIGLDTRTQVAGGPMPNGTFRYAAFTGVNNHGPSQGDPAPTPLGSDVWTFLAAVYDQAHTNLTLYVDLDVATTDDAPQAIVQTAPMGAGATTTAIGAITPGGGEGWVGSIDNVFFLGGRTDAAVVKAVRDQGKEALLQLRPDPVLAATPTSLFGYDAPLPGPFPVTATIEIRNAGATQPLAIVEPRISGRSAARYALADVPASIAPGATARMRVIFDPQGREGAFEAALDLISNSSSDRHARFDLSAFVAYGSPLIAFYPFDDPADPLRNATGKGSDLVVPAGAGPSYEAAGGFEGGAYAFNGAQRLVAPIDIDPGKLPQLTMGAWAKASSLASGLRKVIGHDNGGWDRVIGLDNRYGPLRYTGFTGTGMLTDTPAPTSTEAWTFVAVTYDQASGWLALYVDPDVASTDDPLARFEANTAFGPGFTTTAIGGLRPDNADEGWQGAIDNVFFYQAVLDEDALTRIRNEGAAAIIDTAPRILGVERTTAVTLRWSSRAGQNCIVEYSEALPAVWTKIATVPGQPTSTSYTDSDVTRMSRRQGYYRVGVLP